MTDEDDFDSLLERVKRLTGLGARDAAKIAFAFDNETPGPDEIIAKANELGFDVNDPGADAKRADRKELNLGIGITTSPVEVLTEVYMSGCPRVLTQHVPRLGRAPEQFSEHFAEEIASMPDDVKAMVAKIDVYEGKVTFWLRDEANDVDRPLGPIDLTPYIDADGGPLYAAFAALVPRLGRVLAADCN